MTFGLVLIGFAFFRANTISDAYFIVANSFSGLVSLSSGFGALKPLFERMGVDRSILLPIVAIYVAAEIIDFRYGLITTVNSQYIWIRWLIYIAAVLAIMNLGVTIEAPFIYFRF